mmetsp:Transcript_46797/g.105532  ORF Transcript_46797/g.105532 Transcript_46797/m.105532 type:complete len:100 (-) Transcript_46797:270-569(-)
MLNTSRVLVPRLAVQVCQARGDVKGASDWARKARKLVVISGGEHCPEADLLAGVMQIGCSSQARSALQGEHARTTADARTGDTVNMADALMLAGVEYTR